MEVYASNGTTYPCRLNVPLTLEQAHRVEEAARCAGLKSSVYARHVLSGQPMPEPPRAMLDMEAVRVLQGMGNNLNQIAKIGWQEGWDAPMQAAARQAVLDCAAMLRNLLGLSPLSAVELEQLHPRPVVIERVESKPASGIKGLLSPKPKLGF